MASYHVFCMHRETIKEGSQVVIVNTDDGTRSLHIIETVDMHTNDASATTTDGIRLKYDHMKNTFVLADAESANVRVGAHFVP